MTSTTAYPTTDTPTVPAALQGTQVTQAFAAAADRHRESR